MINPPIVRGQILGGIAQGIGGTLYEDLVYNEDGQPNTAFMDYLVPTIAEIPPVTVEHLGSDSELTPLGIKGVGEGGTVGPPAAIANAVAHALADHQPDVCETPLTPERVLQMMGKFTPELTCVAQRPAVRPLQAAGYRSREPEHGCRA